MSRTIVLWSLFALQSICCVYFLMDVAWDLLWPTSFNHWAESDVIEAMVTFALVIGLAFTANELRLILARQDHLEDQMKIASGAFSEVLETRFHAGSLTAAEREVAVLAIKGFSISEIADLRETKQGTVKAQCTSVYRKSEITGRLQLLSVFLDDLISEDLVKSCTQTAA